jgi:hypothetical protein
MYLLSKEYWWALICHLVFGVQDFCCLLRPPIHADLNVFRPSNHSPKLWFLFEWKLVPHSERSQVGPSTRTASNLTLIYREIGPQRQHSSINAEVDFGRIGGLASPQVWSLVLYTGPIWIWGSFSRFWVGVLIFYIQGWFSHGHRNLGSSPPSSCRAVSKLQKIENREPKGRRRIRQSCKFDSSNRRKRLRDFPSRSARWMVPEHENLVTRLEPRRIALNRQQNTLSSKP